MKPTLNEIVLISRMADVLQSLPAGALDNVLARSAAYLDLFMRHDAAALTAERERRRLYPQRKRDAA